MLGIAIRNTIASEKSIGNYSFFMGVSNDNYDEVMRTNSENVCGIKIFMGSSTGNMLVDNYNTLEHVFANAPTLIATHCEDETTIKNNLARAKESFGFGFTSYDGFFLSPIGYFSFSNFFIISSAS